MTKWAEAEPVMDATAATAAQFIYSMLIARYGCIKSIQFDNESHFVNGVIKNLVETLGVRHRVSTPYYQQSNGKVDRTISPLKAILKGTIAAANAAQNQGKNEEDGDIKVFGVELELDNKILEAIAAGEERRGASVVNELEDGVPAYPALVHWTPLLFMVLWVYRGTRHSATGMSPALLALRHKLKMPAELSDRTMVVPQPDKAHQEIVEKRLQWVTVRIERLPELRRGRRDSTQLQYFQLGQKV